jgi:putative redox protein
VAQDVQVEVALLEKVRFAGRGTGGQEIIIDYPPPLGDDQGLRGGLELLLMGLAVCAGQGVVALLRRMRQGITDCTVRAIGTRRDEHPTVLTGIALEFHITGEALDPETVRKAITLGEEQYCPVWAMLSPATPIRWTMTLNAEDPVPQLNV